MTDFFFQLSNGDKCQNHPLSVAVMGYLHWIGYPMKVSNGGKKFYRCCEVSSGSWRYGSVLTACGCLIKVSHGSSRCGSVLTAHGCLIKVSHGSSRYGSTLTSYGCMNARYGRLHCSHAGACGPGVCNSRAGVVTFESCGSLVREQLTTVRVHYTPVTK